MPTSFDRNIAYTYGKIAKVLVENSLTGFCTSARGLVETPENWFPLALPISHIFELKEKSNNYFIQANTESINLLLIVQMLTSNLQALRPLRMPEETGN